MFDARSFAEPPPIRLLIVTLDTLRADHLGVYGYDKPTSPSIDELALEATVFEDVTCSLPTTLPSHLTLFTGLTPAQHGVTENGMVTTADLVSLFKAMAGRGVRTAGIVATKILDPVYLTSLGLGEVLLPLADEPDAVEAPADAVTDQAITWLSTHGGGTFALWLHYFDPHETYQPPDRLAARFVDPGYDGAFASPSREMLSSLNRKAVASRVSDEDRRHVVALYDGEIAFVDEQLGRLFAFLKRSDQWRDTLIVIVGDHGQTHGEKGYWGHGDHLYEPIIQVPLLVKLPGQTRGRRVQAPVETVDLVPTLVDFYRLELEGEWSGRSLVESLETGSEPGPRAFRLIRLRSYSNSLRPNRRGLALHGGTWKLSMGDDGSGAAVQYRLGRSTGAGGLDGEDLLTPKSPELRHLRDLPEAPEAAPFPISRESLEMLRALGYVD